MEMFSVSSRSVKQQPPLDIVFEADEADNTSAKPDSKKDDDTLELYKLCEKEDWTQAGFWLDKHSNESSRQAILAQAGPSQMTSMHVLCSSKTPSLYLVYRFASIAPQACEVADFAGRLAIHYAIIAAADPRVADVLSKACPNSLMVKDKTGLYPLKHHHHRTEEDEKDTKEKDEKKDEKKVEIPWVCFD